MLRRLLSIFVGTALLASVSSAQSTSVPTPSYGPPIAIAEAQRIIGQGMKLAAAKGFKMSFAVVEPSGELVAFARMDDAPYASIRLAQQKARSSARLRIDTATLEDRVLAGRTVLLSSDEVLAVGGGVPIIVNNRIVGAIGVSGGTVAEDVAIANAIVQDR